MLKEDCEEVGVEIVGCCNNALVGVECVVCYFLFFCFLGIHFYSITYREKETKGFVLVVIPR